MKKYTVIQDGATSEYYHDAITAAHHAYAIAEALRADATRFERMAKAIELDEDDSWRHSGSYLDLEVVVEEV